MQRGIKQVALLAGLVLAMAAVARAQQPADKALDPYRGLTFYESFGGSSSTLGQVYVLNTTLGYNFTKHFGMDVGAPVYFVQPSNTSNSNGFASGNGLGDAYVELRLMFANPILNYSTTLTGTVPTGKERLGFSTGRTTYDWNNHFDRTIPILRLTPFANVGVADTVSDTHFFTRPFTSLGTVTHLEGGATLPVLPMIHVGASVYDLIPSGQQKVFSKLIPRTTVLIQGFPPGAQFSRGQRHGVFENVHEAVGGPSLVRDNGASAWVSVNLLRYAFLEAGFSRSVAYDLNTISFGIGFDAGHIIRTARER